MREAVTPIPYDLSWPKEYQDVLPRLREQWKIEDEIYLRQQLGAGKSGALVYIVDITCDGFSGQAILKLDNSQDLTAQDKSEADRHQEALNAMPGFGAKHLPKILHTLQHECKFATLSTVAGRGLEYASAWSESSSQGRLGALRQLSRDLLEEWNQDYQLAKGLFMPQDLLKAWLGYRLEPERGRLHKFLSERCHLSPQEPSVSFEGQWYPNPLAFIEGVVPLPPRLRIRAVEGRMHGDLHGYNVLVKSHGESDTDYFIIDMAYYQDDQFLFYDHAYFEMAFLVERRQRASSTQWEAMLDHLSLFQHASHSMGLWQDDVGMMEFLHVLRREAMSWVERHESHRLSFMESQCILARVAAGLNFTNKQIDDGARARAFIYAASNLKDYLKLNSVDWPKSGPEYRIDDAVAPNAAAASAPLASPHAPPAEKDRLADRLVSQLPNPQKPTLAIMPFENLTGNAEDDKFVDGVTLEIITELSLVDWLAVLSPSSTFGFKGKTASPLEVTQLFAADYIVEGSVRKDDQSVRVTAHLVDTSTGRHLWADRFDRKIESVSDLQQEIAEAVVGHIDWELKFDLRERARLKRGEISVWDRMQKALWHFFKFTDEDTNTGKGILSKIVDLAPDYALAHAGICFAELRDIFFANTDDPAASKQRALHHAERAVALDDQSSFAHAMLARVCTVTGQHDRAIQEAETSVALNPSSGNSRLVLALALVAGGRAKDALPNFDDALKRGSDTTGPYFKIKLLAKAFCLYLLDDLESAEACAHRGLDGRAVGPYGCYVLAAILVRQNRVDEARRAVEKGLMIRPDITLKIHRSGSSRSIVSTQRSSSTI